MPMLVKKYRPHTAYDTHLCHQAGPCSCLGTELCGVGLHAGVGETIQDAAHDTTPVTPGLTLELLGHDAYNSVGKGLQAAVKDAWRSLEAPVKVGLLGRA